MILKIFTVYDEKAKAYLPPFLLPETGMATRTFADCINSADHQFGKNPQDYTIFALGHFNDASASIQPHAPKSLGNGLEFVTHDTQPDLFERPNETTKRDGSPIQPSTSGGNSS